MYLPLFLNIPLLAFSGVDADGRTSGVTVSPYFSKRLFATEYVSLFFTSSILKIEKYLIDILFIMPNSHQFLLSIFEQC
jgi:hypothetical protein